MIVARRHGFTLIEMLCVMVLLAVIGLIMTLLLRETLDVERVQAASFDQMLQRNALADQFRADAAHSERTLADWRGYASGPDTLILKQGKDHHIVYRWRNGTLTRISFEGEEELERTLPVGGKQTQRGIRRNRLRAGAAYVYAPCKEQAGVGPNRGDCRRPGRRNPMTTKRKGFALITALIVMAVLAIVLTVVTMQIVAQRNLLRQRERQLQADWLARAGVELAAARLLDSPMEFSEERSDLAPAGKVKIDVKKSADVFVVSAEAEVGLAGEKAVIRAAIGRFRRTDSGGVIRLQTVPALPRKP